MIQLTDEEKRVREILIENASQRQAIKYADMIEAAHLQLSMSTPYHRTILGEILGNISIFEHENDRPLLSCVAVLANLKHSDGFFKLADELGYGNWEELKKNHFDNMEMTRTFNYWQRHKG